MGTDRRLVQLVRTEERHRGGTVISKGTKITPNDKNGVMGTNGI